MDTMVKYLREIAAAIELETSYDWELPANLPIRIPDSITDSFSRNVYLKENLAPVLEHDDALDVHYWIIRDWGRIRTFQRGDRNDEVIRKFKNEIGRGMLTDTSLFTKISSLSKLSSFWEPARFAIYDSRAIFSLNWLIFCHASDKQLFPQPIGRNTNVSKYSAQTLFALSGVDHRYRSKKTAYHDYCALLQELSEEIYGVRRKPYFAEMLLFLAAPKNIIEDIERSVTVSIGNKMGSINEHERR